MYKSDNKLQSSFLDFNQPMGLHMNPENRWIKMADMIPWDVFEKKYKHLRWSLKKYENIFRKHCRPVAQYDVDGNLIKRYRSINECKKSFPNVLDALNGEIDSIDGYIFKFVS